MADQSDRIPVVGRTFEHNFGDVLVFHVRYESDNSMTYTAVKGSSEPGAQDTFQREMTELRPNVYMLMWQDADDGSTVTQIEDFERQVVYSNVTTSDDVFVSLTGTLKPVA